MFGISQMSIFAVLTTLLLLYSRHALSQSSAACSLGSWDWTFNSMGQDPCRVAAVLESPCIFYTPSLPALPLGGSYPPSNDSSCKCSSVVYSLLSACAACQGGSWISWSDYIPNCLRDQYIDISRPYVFAIPSGTSVPYWARIDVTVRWPIFRLRGILTVCPRSRAPGIQMNRVLSEILLKRALAR
ncbi:hypothetical protein BGW80DRAFT_286675 [Lactifluus volemus]|nr:hypothetical protein BGW80DRAFT_286675 [Lactifluus volemus]